MNLISDLFKILLRTENTFFLIRRSNKHICSHLWHWNTLTIINLVNCKTVKWSILKKVNLNLKSFQLHISRCSQIRKCNSMEFGRISLLIFLRINFSLPCNWSVYYVLFFLNKIDFLPSSDLHTHVTGRNFGKYTKTFDLCTRGLDVEINFQEKKNEI